MKIRTYGVSKEILSKLTEHIFADFYLRTAETPDVEGVKEVLESMSEHPDLCRMLIMTTAVFCIGNFDRIEKMEGWVNLSEDGQIDLSSLDVLKSKFVV